MDDARISNFLALQAPLLVGLEGERVVILAFAINCVDDHLLALTLGTGGGTVRWVPAAFLDFPPPVMAHPGAPGHSITRKIDA